MTESSYTSEINVLNECIAQFFSADEKDLATLGSILAKIDEVLDDKGLPTDFIEQLTKFKDELGEAMLEGTTRSIIERGPGFLSELVTVLDKNGLGFVPAELTEQQKRFAQENIAVELDKIDELEDAILAVESDIYSNEWTHLMGLLHSLKGDFGVLGLNSFVALTHEVESVIIATLEADRAKLIPMLFGYKDTILVKIREVMSGIFTDITVEEIRAHIGEAAPKEEPRKVSLTSLLEVAAEEDLLVEFITEGKEHVVAAESSLIELENDPKNEELINAAFRSCHTIKGVAGFMNLKPVQELAHSLENIMDSIRMGSREMTSEVSTLLLAGFDHLGDLVKKVEELLPAGSYEIPEEMQVTYEKLYALDSEQNKKGEVVVEEKKVEEPKISEVLPEDLVQKEARTLINSLQDVKPKELPAAAAKFQERKTRVEETVRVSVQRLDRLIDSIGEIVIAQSILTADPDFVRLKSRSIEQKATQISMVMRQIQEEAMSLRMVSLKSTFQKMSRLVRDLSQKMGKPVNFKISGEDTELDKSIIEHIGDPLVHMLRNSVDHGLESVAERAETDKPSSGNVELRAYHKSGNVVIDIIDDGRGLSRKKLLKKAIENGIADPNRDYSDQEVFHFIFEPGFSTAEEITDVSGRGVGMDVVKRNIVGLRGNLEIFSEEGKGTCFSIKLPLTMAIIDGMVVSAGTEAFILPTLSIITSVNPKKEQIQSVRGKGEMLHLHDQLYRFVRLSDLLELNVPEKSVEEGIAILIENISGQRVALWVDAIVKKQQVVIKSMGQLFQKYKWISGGAVLGDGKVNLILDVNELFQLMDK